MKQLTILLISFISLTINAQKVIEKTINYNDQRIEMDVKFASNIEVKTWNKSTIYFKASIEADDDQFLDLYELDVDESSTWITITSDAGPVFKASRKDCLKNNRDKKDNCYNNGDKFKFNYVLYVPKNATFKVSSINGNLKSENIEGEFAADLINGDIEIITYSGNLDLKTINGAIDLKMINANLVAETIHGDIFADEKLNFTSRNRHVGQKIFGKTGSGNNNLQLNTINGNMYLRL